MVSWLSLGAKHAAFLRDSQSGCHCRSPRGSCPRRAERAAPPARPLLRCPAPGRGGRRGEVFPVGRQGPGHGSPAPPRHNADGCEAAGRRPPRGSPKAPGPARAGGRLTWRWRLEGAVSVLRSPARQPRAVRGGAEPRKGPARAVGRPGGAQLQRDRAGGQGPGGARAVGRWRRLSEHRSAACAQQVLDQKTPAQVAHGGRRGKAEEHRGRHRVPVGAGVGRHGAGQHRAAPGCRTPGPRAAPGRRLPQG